RDLSRVPRGDGPGDAGGHLGATGLALVATHRGPRRLRCRRLVGARGGRVRADGRGLLRPHPLRLRTRAEDEPARVSRAALGELSRRPPAWVASPLAAAGGAWRVHSSRTGTIVERRCRLPPWSAAGARQWGQRRRTTGYRAGRW